MSAAAAPGHKKYYSAFTPLDIPGCQLWLDASDSSTLTLSGSNITAWNDKSGNGRNMTASGTITNTGSINGLTAANWTSDAYFYGSASNTGNTVTVFAVFNMTSSTSPVAARVVSLGVSGTADYNNVSYAAPILRRGGTIVGAYRNGTELSRNTNATDQAVLMCSLFNGSTNTIYTNGTASSSVASTGNFNYTQHRIGSSTEFDSGSYFRGTIGEVIIYNDALSDANRQIVEGYLSRKWFRVGFTNILVPIGPFVPTSISSCQLWLDAADTSSLTLSGSNVTAWNDKSGTSRTVTFSGTSTYNSTNKTVSTSSSSFFYANVDSRKTTVPNLNVFIVYKWQGSTLGTSQTLWGNDVGGGWNRVQILSFPADTTLAYGLSYAGTSPNIVAVSGLNNSNQLLYNATYSFGVASATGVYINGIPASSFVTEAAASSQTSTTNTYFGTLNGSTYIAPIDFYEVIIFNSSLTTTQRRQVEGYLTMKWGIQPSITGVSSTHPYYSIVPVTRQFAPIDVPGCSLWLDATDTTSFTFSSGTNISQWRDKSSSGLTGTGVNSPTYSSNALNGYPGVVFNGSSQYFDFGNVLNMGTSSIYVFSVCKFDTTSDGSIIGKSSYRANTGRWWLNRVSGDGGLSMGVDVGGGGILAKFSDISTAIRLLSGYWDRSTVYVFQNGTQQATASLSNSTNLSNTDPLYVGAYPNSTGTGPQTGVYLPDKIGEILVYLGSLTTGQRQQIEGYLSKKWGLLGSTSTFVPFSPTSISGCQLWLDATDTTSLTLSGSNVTQWRDKSSNALTATGVNSPTYSSNVLNGFPGVVFNGTSQYFNFGNVLNLGTSQIFVFVVSKFDSTANGGIVGKTSARGNPARWAFLRESGVMNWIIEGSTIGAVVPTFSDTNTNARLLTGFWDRSNSYVFENGIQRGVVSAADSSNLSNTDPLYVGAYPNSTGTGPQAGLYFPGKIGEIIVYLGSLTTTQRQQVEGYLANKWGFSGYMSSTHPYALTGLPPTHPYISRNPATPVFNPRQISNCALWLDAADYSSLTLSGSNVTQWRDKSGNGRNFTLLSGFSYPTISNGGLNSFNAVSFAGPGTQGSSSSQILTNASFPLNSSASGYTIFTVTKQNASHPSYTGYNYIISAYAGAGLLYGTSNTNYFITSNGTAGPSYGFNDLTPNVPNTLMTNTTLTGIVVSGSTLTPYLNGTAMTAKTGTCIALTGLSIGDAYATGQTYSGQNWNGLIGEILIYNAVLTTAQRQQVEGYLTWKWGLNGGYMPTLTPFRPTSISGCQLWLDAADTSSLTLSGSNVTQWRDKSGNNLHASNTSNYPSFSNSNINFVTSNQLKLSPFIPAGSQNITLAIVWKTTSVSNASFQSIIENSPTFNTNYGGWWRFMTYQYGFGSRNADYYGLNEYGGNPTPLSNMPTFTANTMNLSFITQYSTNGTNFTINNYHNGSLYGTQSYTGAIVAGVQGTMGLNSNSESFNGSIAEVVIFLAQLTDTQRQQVEGYLATKWGLQGNLPSSHPYASRSIPSTHPYKLIKP